MIEVPGTSIKRLVQKSDPFKEDTCKKERTCMVCGSGGEGRCREYEVTYEVECKECGGKYIGETARNAYTRGLEHKTGLNKKDKNSALHEHCMEEHEGRPAEFKMKVTGTYRKDPLKRQISESIRIEETQNLLNRKDEWRQLKLPRAQLRLV